MYMSPEIATGDPSLDERSDVYLLGATLHHILTGQPRHLAPTVKETMLIAKISAPYVYSSEIFADLGLLANRACHKDPNQRPRTKVFPGP